MRLKNWLLAGTGLGMLAATAAPAFAQSDIITAYQAYIAAQQSGDAAALSTAEAAFADHGLHVAEVIGDGAIVVKFPVVEDHWQIGETRGRTRFRDHQHGIEPHVADPRGIGHRRRGHDRRWRLWP